MVLGTISTILVSLPVYCVKDKMNQEKKPFKRDEIRGKLEEKQLIEVGKYFKEFKDLVNLSCTNKKYKNLVEKYDFNPVICLFPWPDLLRFENAVTYKIYSGQKFVVNYIADHLLLDVKKIIFETGSIGTHKFSSILKHKNLRLIKEDWKKEILPFKDEGISGASSSPAGFKIIFTNEKIDEKIVFLFEFGNVCMKKSREEYSLEKERFRYNIFLKEIKKMNPENPNKMNLEAVKVLDVKKVVISSKIENIKNSSFIFYNNLECVEIISDVNSVGEYAFSYCEKLKQVIFRGKVLRIEDSVFTGCKSLEKLQLPEGIVHIGSNCFKNCNSLKEIVISESTKEIYLDTFEGTPSDLKIFYFGKEYNKDEFFKTFIDHEGTIRK